MYYTGSGLSVFRTAPPLTFRFPFMPSTSCRGASSVACPIACAPKHHLGSVCEIVYIFGQFFVYFFGQLLGFCCMPSTSCRGASSTACPAAW